MAYNIGGTLGDIYSPDSVPLEFDFYVEEIISNPKNFEHTYIDKETGERKFWKYDSRYERVLSDAFKNRSKIKPLRYILKYISKWVSLADSVASYNWAFDRQAFQKTVLELQNENYKEFERIPNWCVLDCYANKMITMNYFRFVDSLDPIYRKAYLSHSGKNYGYSAQAMARWILKRSNTRSNILPSKIPKWNLNSPDISQENIRRILKNISSEIRKLFHGKS